jgi:hypothetical protein
MLNAMNKSIGKALAKPVAYLKVLIFTADSEVTFGVWSPEPSKH